jgi:signal peptidase I
MKSQRGQIAAGIVVVAVLVPLWLFLGPTQLGGAATYSITDGISMKPLLVKGDLALVRSQSSYKVGEIVLYQSSTLHKPVLHRIVVIQNGHYFFKGDNNDFVDPGYATRSELTGKLWFHVRYVGSALGWIGKPWHAALLASLTAAFLLLGGVTTGRRRKRRRGPLTVASAPPEHEPHYLEPMTRATLASIAALTALGLLFVGIGFAAPTDRAGVTHAAYQSTGAYSYRAKVLKANSTYPSGFATTGQPLFRGLINSATFAFKYRFESSLPHAIHGTIELKALILSTASSWQNLYDVEVKRSFVGDTATTGGPLKLNNLFELLDQLSAAAATAGAEYSVDLQPVVHISGTVDGKPISSTFSPVLPLSATSLAVKLAVATAALPPGATYTPQSGVAALAATLKPSQAGDLPNTARNHITIARYRIPVLNIRLLGLLALAFAGLGAILHGRLLRRDSQRSVEEQIAAHFGLLVTSVDALVLPAGVLPTPVHDFTGLATLARYLERPILRKTDTEGRTYTVDDETRVYEYRAKPAAVAPADVVPTSFPVAHTADPWRSRMIGAGALVGLVVVLTVAVSFTASNTVPVTHVGKSAQARTLVQLIPSQCAALNLVPTNLITSTSGTTTVTGTTGDDLMLGPNRSGTVVYHGQSGDDCIVAGGTSSTTNQIDGGGGYDVCIGAPAATNTFTNCYKHYNG